jgi:benzoate membrane transport protein
MRLSIALSAIVAALVGFGGTLALIVSAAHAVGADASQAASWVTALCLAMALTSAYLSIRHRIPVITAWSTPGAALIASTAGSVRLDAAVGAFLLAGLLAAFTAAFRPIAALVERIPTPIAGAMLAGVLIRFVVAVFEHGQHAPALVLPLVGLFLVARLVSPAGAVLVALAAGLVMAWALGLTADLVLRPSLPQLIWTAPRLDAGVLIGLGVPLYLVTMASQNLPGFAVLRAAGYAPPARSILAVTGFASIVTAPFGAHATNLAAITASICTGPDVHPDPSKRWLTGPVYGLVYLALAAVAASCVTLIAAMPVALIATVAGVALIGPLANALSTAMSGTDLRLAATLTLAVTASGMTLAGIGSAFWGLTAGLIAAGLELGAEYRRARRDEPTVTQRGTAPEP